MKLLPICLLLTSSFIAERIKAQLSYDAASIPIELKTNARVVKRYENIRFQVKDIDRAVYSVHRVYTIMDEKGADKMFFREYTNRYRKIDEFEIKSYDAAGNVTAKYKKRDLTREARTDGLIHDGATYFIKLSASKYPVTIEYKYEVDYAGTYSFPSYEIQEPGESVLHSSFTAIVPQDLGLRYKPRFSSVQPTINTEGTNKSFSWNVDNVAALPVEESEEEEGNYSPAIILGANRFKFYGTYGDMSSWKSLGAWGYELMKGLDDLPENRKQFFSQLTKDAKSDKEKAQIVYDYLQKNFRYVSIQLGIGGFQPFPASFTDEKKYGDCKGLSFFMYSVLKHLGVKSYCAWVRSDIDQERNDPNFPVDRFNHVILCIPQKEDTIWLECTSNTAEFGVLYSSTSDKDALLLTEHGGVLVATPRGQAQQHLIKTSSEVWIEEDGSGKAKTSLSSKGIFREFLLQMIESKPDDQKWFLIHVLDFKQPDAFQITPKSKTGNIDLDVDLLIEKIPQFMAGSKMFLSPRLNPMWTRKLPATEKRKTDYYFMTPFLAIDTTTYHLPDGYVAEVLPKKAEFKCEYADFTSEFMYDANSRSVISIGKLQLNKNRIPANKYNEVKEYFDRVLSSESQKLVVKKG